jgi:hypothetical protein
MDEHTPAFTICAAALIGLKGQTPAEAQPAERAPLGNTEDDVSVEHREVDWQDDRDAVGHVSDSADDRLLEKLEALLTPEGLEVGLLELAHLPFSEFASLMMLDAGYCAPAHFRRREMGLVGPNVISAPPIGPLTARRERLSQAVFSQPGSATAGSNAVPMSILRAVVLSGDVQERIDRRALVRISGSLHYDCPVVGRE